MNALPFRRSLLPVAALAVLLTAACGGDDGSPTGGRPAASANPSAESFVPADVTFAQMMIPHHEEAVEMAALAGTRAADPEIKQLAQQITATQEQEIETLTGWLTAWGEPLPADGDMGHDMSGESMPGAVTAADMEKLEAASGAAFDQQWLTLMTAHHDGAITMAEQQLAEGANADAKALAQKIATEQRAEIQTIKSIQARL